MPTKRGGGRGEDRGGKKGMKSGNPRHISIEKRERNPKANVTEQSKETKMS